MKVELIQIVGRIDTAIGPRETLEHVDRVMVNGVLAGYLDRRPGARLHGFRPCIPQDAWPEIAAEVKNLRPDMDDSEIGGVSQAAVDLAEEEEDEIEADDDDE